MLQWSKALQLQQFTLRVKDGARMPRSYVEEWQSWGIVTGLQTLLLNMQVDGKQTASTADILLIARMYQLEEDLLKRMSYVPDDLEDLDHR
jgi:hypothetical protein